MHRLAPLVILAAVTWPPSAPARGLESWPYRRLLKEADVVVVATALSSADAGESTRDNLWQAELVGVNTTFAVEAVLKGKLEGDRLRVLHYRLRPGVLIEDGPLLVSFRTGGLTLTTKGAKVALSRPSYLLFLKAGKDGRYEPVSGRTDPALSVREMYKPLPEELGAEKPE
jgi:hypothetical protein